MLTAAALLPVDAPASVGDLRSWRDVELPGLSRRDEIYAWLPPGYDRGTDRYPVLYLHDGQNMFLPERTAGGASWRVGEAMSALAAEGLCAIVIAVPCHAELRSEEYTQYRHGEDGGGRAADYATFLVEHLKPAVDAVLRTEPGPAHTVVAGSSLGGVVSAYLWERHPDVFGGAGLFSPAFWWVGEQAISDLEAAARVRGPGSRVYLDVGGHELPEDPAIEQAYVADAERVLGSLREAGVPVRYVFDSAAYHFESAWAERFPSAAAWLLAGYEQSRPAPAL